MGMEGGAMRLERGKERKSLFGERSKKGESGPLVVTGLFYVSGEKTGGAREKKTPIPFGISCH